MSAKLVVVLSFLVSTAAFAAAAQGQWVMVSHTLTKATTPAEIAALQQKYPNQLGQIDLRATTFASVDELNLEYQGATVCRSGDPRLKQTAYSVETCTSNSTGADMCTAGLVAVSGNDPCAP